MQPLHTAYSFQVTESEAGLTITLREELKIIPTKNKLDIEKITDERVENPRSVTLFQASYNTVDRMIEHMNSLTDSLIYGQWFRAKEHKKGKGK